MASLAQIRNKADTKLAQFWSILIAKQEAYWQKHGTFFGFNWTPAAPVVDGADTDLGEVQRPSRKHVAADVNFPVNEKVPYQIQVVRHHGDQHGFTATVVVELANGNKYTRSRTAYPVVQEEVIDPTDLENPVVVTPRVITDWTIETTPWTQVIDIVI